LKNKEILAADKQLVEERLDRMLPRLDRLTESMRYSLLAGGKRLRPILTLEFCRACGGDAAAALDAACAIEMLHTSSLIHDDLPAMDDDELRRGKPTNHVVYGEWLALLAGDALQAEAYAAILRSDSPPLVRAEAARILAEAAGYRGICGGQFLDLDGEERTLTEEEIYALNDGKTASLIAAACMMGCVCAEAYDKLPAADACGRAMGAAFQLRDDLLDVESSTSELGKPVGSDAKNGKSTLLALRGADFCRDLVRARTEEALAILRKDFGAPEFLLWLTEQLAGRKK
jgi:geranylgeranyl diphosphate synthase type II